MHLGETDQSCKASIRPAHESDATDIASIHIRSFRATYTKEVPQKFLGSLNLTGISTIWRSRIQQLTTERKVLLVASNANQRLGFCYVGPVAEGSGTAMIYSLHVNPDNQRSGIGSLLLSKGTQTLFQSGYSNFELWVVVTNSMAIKFYEKHGWVNEGTTRVDTLSLNGGTEPRVEVVRYRLQQTPI